MVDITKENAKLREEVEDITRELKYLTLKRRKAEEAADSLLERNNILEEQNAILLCRIQDLEDHTAQVNSKPNLSQEDLDMRRSDEKLSNEVQHLRKLIEAKDRGICELYDREEKLLERIDSMDEQAAKFVILKAMVKFLDDETEDHLELARDYQRHLDMPYDKFTAKYYDM